MRSCVHDSNALLFARERVVCSEGPATLLESLVRVVATLFRLPIIKLSPLAAEAWETIPAVRATITVRPTRMEVPLASHTTPLTNHITLEKIA